jgi:transcriptional regulator with XRE-family HTH domain
MDRHRRTDLELDGVMEAAAIAGSLGRELRTAARRRRLTQAQLGRRVGLSGARIGELQRGKGANAPLTVWVKLGMAIGRPLAVSFSREAAPNEPRDAGHLAAQELVLALARRHGRRADFELPTRPTDPARSIDVALRDDHARAIIVVEIWNRLDDLGAAARTTTRKASEADGLAVLAAGDGPSYRVATCWLFVDTAANRRLVARYPEILQSRFPGSSFGWARCLSEGRPPPGERGLAWIDPRSGRLVPLRHRRPPPTDPRRSVPEVRR